MSQFMTERLLDEHRKTLMLQAENSRLASTTKQTSTPSPVHNRVGMLLATGQMLSQTLRNRRNTSHMQHAELKAKPSF